MPNIYQILVSKGPGEPNREVTVRANSAGDAIDYALQLHPGASVVGTSAIPDISGVTGEESEDE